MDYGSLQTIASKLGLLTVKEEGTKPKLYVWPQTKMVRDSLYILHSFRFKFLLLEITSLHHPSLISHTVFYYLKHFWKYTLLEHSSSVLNRINMITVTVMWTQKIRRRKNSSRKRKTSKHKVHTVMILQAEKIKTDNLISCATQHCPTNNDLNRWARVGKCERISYVSYTSVSTKIW